ncbi:MAG: UDP-N-acetylmuramate:L-alanyl-gamma-D-glutamyl-meso-diaminopimelate ligase, partial [Deltaproteobacteria bacterium]|nr:UDP-N-acetylmuramate:L-alanyl-gamma-D-glutamyl-meso-diaminopimelate ligase [Deltaproteobacteria bacterium]
SIAAEDRFDPDRLVTDARDHGVDAIQADSVDHIVQLVADGTKPGDLVLILSNGGFGGIYESLPAAIEAREV